MVFSAMFGPGKRGAHALVEGANRVVVWARAWRRRQSI
jgi:hypothetical protein